MLILGDKTKGLLITFITLRKAFNGEFSLDPHHNPWDRCCFCPHFTEGKIEEKDFLNCQSTQFISGKGSIWFSQSDSGASNLIQLPHSEI